MSSRWMLLAAVVISATLGACSKHESADTYDPRIDGVLPQAVASGDPTILDDPKTLRLQAGPATPARPAPTLTPSTGAATGPKPETAPGTETAPGPETPAEPILPPTDAGPVPAPPDAPAP